MGQENSTSSGITSWSVIAAYATLAGVTQLLWVTYTPITSAAAAEWGVSVDAVGWLAQTYPLLYVLLAVPFGYWADRRFKDTLATGAALTVAGALLRVIPGYGWTLAGQLAVSVGQPLVLNAVNKLAVEYASPARRPAAIAAGTASLFVGILLSTVTSPFLMEWGGLAAVQYIQAMIAVAACIWFALAIRRPPLYSIPRRPDGISPAVKVRSVWSNRWVRLYALLLFAGFGLFIALTTWLEVLSEPAGMASKQVGVCIGGMTLAGIFGAAVVPGWAATNARRARLAICASLAVSAAALAALASEPPLWLYLFVFVAAGFLLLANLPVILSSAETRASPEEAGTVTGLLLLFGNLGGIVLTIAVQLLIGRPLAAIGLLVLIVLAAVPIGLRFPGRGA